MNALRKPPAADGPLPIAGVELGGTKCVCILAHGPGQVIAQVSLPTTDAATTLALIEEVLLGWWQSFGFRALGIASMGPLRLDPAAADYGHILATTKPGWPGADIAGRLGRHFPVPVAFDTDVNGAAIAECTWGAGQGLQDFAYITVGTGVGVGLVVNGRTTRGIGHCEMGHLRVPRLPGDTGPSGCRFHDDCVEGLASGSAVKSRLGQQHVSEIAPDHPVWDVVVEAVTALCHALVCTTGPQRIVLGGGVMQKQPHLVGRIGPALRASIAGYVEIPHDADYVVVPGLGDMAGPLGPIAMAMALERDRAAADA
ncbi:ROK family protein [Novosphingobium sp.]|uniref:ROK family protein n=1 Tax=Novosphingobium sp. TaxID=1874826 RepID=UPI002626C8AA|nr:ROK family protein [Novosphingobium sp.]